MMPGAGGGAFPTWLKDYIRWLPGQGVAPFLTVQLANYYKLPVLVDWFDDAGWVELLGGYRQFIADAKSCGVERFHIDPEEYGSGAGNSVFSGDKGAYWYVRPMVATGGFPAYPHTAAEQCAKAWVRGVTMGGMFVDAIPSVKFTHYYVRFPGGFNDILQQRVNGAAPAVDSPMASFFAGWIASGGKHAFINFDIDKVTHGILPGGWDGPLAQDRNSTVWLAGRIVNWSSVKDNVSFGGACAISPIEDGVGPFKAAYSPDYVRAQLAAFARANTIVMLYEQRLSSFDYGPYFPAIKAAAAISPAVPEPQYRPVTITVRDASGAATSTVINIATR